jgi:Holliday junction DNA helicase RuvA
MIARITGRLEEIGEAVALVSTASGLWYEVLIPAFDAERLGKRVGAEVSLFTIHYVEGDPSHGAVTPRLLGFLAETDRAFFRVFTTVKGIGIRKALRALIRPVAEVATAIMAKDSHYLVELPEIGKRTAEQIIVELHEKMEPFAGAAGPAGGAEEPMSEAAAEAVSVLVQLGERRGDAQSLVERVLAVAPESESPEAIIQQAYRLKAGGI